MVSMSNQTLFISFEKRGYKAKAHMVGPGIRCTKREARLSPLHC